MSARIKEGSYFEVEARFFDSDGAVALPANIHYQIACLTTGKTIRDWTSVPIGTVVTIIATPDDNVIQNSKNARERKQMVVRSDSGTNLQTVNSIDWIVDNLQSVT